MASRETPATPLSGANKRKREESPLEATENTTSDMIPQVMITHQAVCPQDMVLDNHGHIQGLEVGPIRGQSNVNRPDAVQLATPISALPGRVQEVNSQQLVGQFPGQNMYNLLGTTQEDRGPLHNQNYSPNVRTPNSAPDLKGNGEIQNATVDTRQAPSSTPATPAFIPDSHGLSKNAFTFPPPRLTTVSPHTNLQQTESQTIHKRRASASPKKFNIGNFEPLRVNTTQAQLFLSTKRVKTDETDQDGDTSPVEPTQAQPEPEAQFNIIKALLIRHDLLLHVVTYMTIPTLIKLYSISKPFHFLFNSHYTTYIRAVMSNLAPGSQFVFHWKLYKSLCVKDPTGRKDEVYERYVLRSDNLAHIQQWRANRDHIRDVPSLKWLQMVVWRHGVCKDILIQLASKGLRCPKGTLEALKRFWLIMDLPTNFLRIQAIRHERLFPTSSLELLTHFLIKLDMYFTNPLGRVFKQLPAGQDPDANHMMRGAWGHGAFVGCEFRKLILSEHGLAALWRVLHDWSWDVHNHQMPFSRMDVLRLWIRHKYQIPENIPPNEEGQPIMGIPSHEVGTGSLERRNIPLNDLLRPPSSSPVPVLPRQFDQRMRFYPHGKHLQIITSCGLTDPPQCLLRPDELVMKEAIRRQLSLQKQWLRMMTWGFCDDLGRNLPIKTAEELLLLSRKPSLKNGHYGATNNENFKTPSSPAGVKPPGTRLDMPPSASFVAGPWSNNELYNDDERANVSSKSPMSIKTVLKEVGIQDEEIEDHFRSPTMEDV